MASSLVRRLCIRFGIIDQSLFPIDLPRVEPVNLGKTSKLKAVALRCWSRPGWILETLQTVTRDHKELKWITIQAVSGRGLNEGCEGVKDAIGEISYREWLELDQVLAQLCESHSVQLRVAYNLHVDMDGSKERDRMEVLMPEVMARGLVDWSDGEDEFEDGELEFLPDLPSQMNIAVVVVSHVYTA